MGGSWKLRLVNDGVKVDELDCEGSPPAVGARVFLSEDQYDILNYPDAPFRVRRTVAVVIAQDARIENQTCSLLIIARVESRGVFCKNDR